MSSDTGAEDVGKPLPSEDDPRPVVALPPPALPGAVIAVVAVLLAVLLFIMLDAQRRSAGAASSQPDRAMADAFTLPPPLVVPPEPAPLPVVAVVTTATAPTPPMARQYPVPRPSSPALSYTPPVLVPIPDTLQPSSPPLIERRPTGGSAPAMVFDNGEQAVQSTANARGAPAGSAAARAGGAAGTDETPARITRIANQTNVMPTGTIIPAVLETPIDTARPGLLRALVSEDTRGFDGRRVLVPKGSRLIGEYQADVRANQNRVLVTWTRLIRPDGAAIRLGSPASDPLGGAGVPGRLHTYFFERFASAVLQSALTVGVNLASRPRNGSVIVGLPGATVNNVVGQGLIPQNSLQPKITVKQGTVVNVFVARDLDFSGVASRP